MNRWKSWDWDTTEAIEAVLEENDEEKPEEQEELEPCPYCGGSGLSPYERDGGSCPHCFNGYIEEK